MVDRVSLIDTSVMTFGQTIGGSAVLSFLALVVIGIGVFVIIQRLQAPPRLDPTRHMERPPIEHQPTRSLPPAGKYVEWEEQKDKQKEDVPWRR